MLFLLDVRSWLYFWARSLLAPPTPPPTITPELWLRLHVVKGPLQHIAALYKVFLFPGWEGTTQCCGC